VTISDAWLPDRDFVVAPPAPQAATVDIIHGKAARRPASIPKNAVILKAGERLSVQTQNTRYTVFMIRTSDQTVLIQGGRHFPRTTRAVLLGSAKGECEIHPGVLVLGQAMVLAEGGRCVVTSHVLGVRKERGRFEWRARTVAIDRGGASTQER